MASGEDQIVLAFDLYGTLLSTESIAKELATYFGNDKATEIASLWRRYQLEYTWRLNSMGRAFPRNQSGLRAIANGFSTEKYQPFSSVTRNSLRHVLSELGLSLDDNAVEKVMKAYDSLSTFPDVSPALEAIAEAPGITPIIFSNGTAEMVRNSVYSSPDLGPHAPLFKKIVSVEPVRRYKPHPTAYYEMAVQVGKSRDEMENIWLVSGNPFDIVGARTIGMQAVWVNRKGGAWADALSVYMDDEVRPSVIVQDLKEVMKAVRMANQGL